MSNWYEFIRDAGKFSMSRLCLGAMNLTAIAAVIWLLYLGKGTEAAVIVTGVTASDAGVYFASTRRGGKDGDNHRPGVL